MNKAILLLIVFLSCIISVSALDICEDSIGINQTCLLLTPQINCSIFNYSIFNVTNFINGANLTNISTEEGLYYFPFNMSKEGGYIVKLCDGSTREIYVQGDKNNMIDIMIFLACITIILGFLSYSFEKELKFFFIALTMLLICVGLNVSAQFASSLAPGIGTILWGVYKVSLWLFGFIIFYIMVKLTIAALTMRASKKEKEFMPKFK